MGSDMSSDTNKGRGPETSADMHSENRTEMHFDDTRAENTGESRYNVFAEDSEMSSAISEMGDAAGKALDSVLSALSKLAGKCMPVLPVLAEWIIFAALAVLLLNGLSERLMPKNTYQTSAWPTTNTVNGFYKMAPNSVDVLFLGSSVVVNGFCPQEIYNDYGIRSYNLASEQQSIFLSYYWLKEALRLQRPKAVVLDLKFIAPRPGYEPLNTTEGLTRICIDRMKWSPVKVEAVMDIARITHKWAAENNTKGQSAMSYFLPFMRYHSRWKYGLWDSDFDKSISGDSPLKGWNPLIYFPTGGAAGFTPYVRGDSEERSEVDEIQKEYLYKIGDLCRENDIQLILTNLPSNTAAGETEMTDAFDNVCSDMAQELGADYYNFSEESLYMELGIRSVRETVFGHSNYWGSIRLSKYIGKLLSKTYRIRSEEDAQYEATKPFFLQVTKNANLQYISDLNEYLDAIHDPTYTVFFAVRDEGSLLLDDNALEKLKALGIGLDLKDKFQYSWYAVVDFATGVQEDISENQKLSETGIVGRDKIAYSISSAGLNSGNPSCSIAIDGKEIANNTRGINIVVWDNTCRSVIDSVSFDMYGHGEPYRIWFTTPKVSNIQAKW